MKIGVADWGLFVWNGGLYDYEDRIEMIRGLGFDGLERIYPKSPEDALNKAAFLKKRGMSFATCNNDDHELAIKWTAALGGDYIWASGLNRNNFETYLRQVDKLTRAAEKYGVKREAAKAALGLIEPRGSERITASAKLLEAIATYLRASELVSLGMEDLSGRIAKYVEERLSERLDTSEICDTFFISRTKLHTLAVASFGMSISQYISQKRLAKAKKLLSENRSIESISEECGYSSANYFAKVFGKAFGISPSEYRKRKNGQIVK